MPAATHEVLPLPLSSSTLPIASSQLKPALATPTAVVRIGAHGPRGMGAVPVPVGEGRRVGVVKFLPT
jgi:hypothetical protein